MIEGQVGNRKEKVPEVGGERGVDGREDGNEVIFVSANRPLGGIGPVWVGGVRTVR